MRWDVPDDGPSIRGRPWAAAGYLLLWVLLFVVMGLAGAADLVR